MAKEYGKPRILIIISAYSQGRCRFANWYYSAVLVDLDDQYQLDSRNNLTINQKFYINTKYLFKISRNEKIFNKLRLTRNNYITGKYLKYKFKNQKLLDMLLSDNNNIQEIAKNIIKQSFINDRNL